MAFETTNINYSMDLGINYIPCCKVVLMLYNGINKRFFNCVYLVLCVCGR